jgi:UDP-N-acetylglucosamine 2-epimerase (non-hydrolysing)
MIRPLFIFGTRPEAIKFCPVIRHMKSRSHDFDVRVCVTAQHREMLDQVLAFEVTRDRDLDIMRPVRPSTSPLLASSPPSNPILAEEEPDIALVLGDTTTTVSGSLAGFYANVRVGHVEAGLRTGDLREPFPEELNRVLTGKLASFHFAATEGAAQNLYRVGVDRSPPSPSLEIRVSTLFCMSKRLLMAARWPASTEFA